MFHRLYKIPFTRGSYTESCNRLEFAAEYCMNSMQQWYPGIIEGLEGVTLCIAAEKPNHGEVGCTCGWWTGASCAYCDIDSQRWYQARNLTRSVKVIPRLIQIEVERMEAGAQVIAGTGTPVPDGSGELHPAEPGMLKGRSRPQRRDASAGDRAAQAAQPLREHPGRQIRPCPGVKVRRCDSDPICRDSPGDSEDLYLQGLQAHRRSGRRRATRRSSRRRPACGSGAYAFPQVCREHFWATKEVTAVHKANIVKLADGLFLQSSAAALATIRKSNMR